MNLYGRRKSDGWAQALVWLQILLAAILYGINMLHMIHVAEAMADLRAEAAAMRRERKVLGQAGREFLEAVRRHGLIEEAPPDNSPSQPLRHQ